MIMKGEADIIIGFEPGEAVRMLPYLRNGGTVVTNNRAIMPTTATLSGFKYSADEMIDYLKSKAGNVVVVDGDVAMKELQSSKVLNIVLLGAALRSTDMGINEDYEYTYSSKYYDIGESFDLKRKYKYIRIRAYKVSDSGEYIYSAWSTVH